MPGESLHVLYDGTCRFCLRMMRVVRVLDWLRCVVPVNSRGEMRDQPAPLRAAAQAQRLEGAIGIWDGRQIVYGFEGLRRLSRCLPLTAWLWPFLFLPPIPYLGRRGYAWVARNRYRLGGPCGAGHCEGLRPPSEDTDRALSMQGIR